MKSGKKVIPGRTLAILCMVSMLFIQSIQKVEYMQLRIWVHFLKCI